MPKGTITANNEKGLYDVNVEFDVSVIDERVEVLDATIADYQAMIENADDDGTFREEIEKLNDEIADLQEAIDNADERYDADEIASLKEQIKVKQERLNDSDDLDDITIWQLEIASAEAEKLKLLTVKIKATAQAGSPGSCVDYTEDLSGEVGLIIIGRERANGVNIQPGYDGNAAYDEERDGAMVPLLAQSPAATFYNLAMLPGYQKWKPTYRYGTITSIDYEADTCTVMLEELKSSQQEIDINFAESVDAYIRYMNCNSAAFETDDEVVVWFDGYDYESTPVVIGFKNNPKPCFLPSICIYFNDETALLWNIKGDVPLFLQGLEYPASVTDINDALTAAGISVKALTAYSWTPDSTPDDNCTYEDNGTDITLTPPECYSEGISDVTWGSTVAIEDEDVLEKINRDISYENVGSSSGSGSASGEKLTDIYGVDFCFFQSQSSSGTSENLIQSFANGLKYVAFEDDLDTREYGYVWGYMDISGSNSLSFDINTGYEVSQSIDISVSYTIKPLLETLETINIGLFSFSNSDSDSGYDYDIDLNSPHGISAEAVCNNTYIDATLIDAEVEHKIGIGEIKIEDIENKNYAAMWEKYYGNSLSKAEVRIWAQSDKSSFSFEEFSLLDMTAIEAYIPVDGEISNVQICYEG